MKYSLDQQTSNFSYIPIPPTKTIPNSSIFQIPNLYNPSLQLTSPSTLLGKRNFQDQEQFSDRDPEKKVKVSLQEELLRIHNPSHLSSELLGFNKYGFASTANAFDTQNPAMKALLYQMNQGFQTKQQAQYLHFLLMKNQFEAGQNISFHLNNEILKQVSNSKNMVKDRKEEEPDLSLKSTACNDKSEKSQSEEGKSVRAGSYYETTQNQIKHREKAEQKKKKGDGKKEEEPLLAEFTKAYPEWDLCTIFEFIKSGKSKENFESERKTRKTKKARTVKKNTLKRKLRT